MGITVQDLIEAGLTEDELLRVVEIAEQKQIETRRAAGARQKANYRKAQKEKDAQP